ncbi:putative tellurium resistance membrane protein TerC [Chitinophaga dinghuensis]|uniref:Putative tellurium resistance membrane protein TerC n=1 Tax=Chitinophaga dinghuensis TaxID=1539050 RepID=A0A327VK07_9BACT|nr:TerC family protein [Chitinophaga dinghuensis]RAJ75040.1 putative tellurium resistance membrane protein TerC [Chitinophaga dinghuensis]
MEQFLTAESLISLLTLILMEVVLGIDNVIFVSIVLNRLPAEKRPAARRIWMFAGMAIRIVLLLCIGYIVRAVHPLFSIGDHGFSLRDLIMLGGGLFLLVKTTLEIHHKLEGEEETASANSKKGGASFLNIVGQIILIDTVFSFDSIITAVGLARQIPVMIIAVIIAMIVMFLFAPRISDFIHKHPTLKMLALSFLVMVGAILIVEGWNAEQAHALHLKNYVYFAMAFSFAVELLNMRVRKNNKPVELKEPTIKE